MSDWFAVIHDDAADPPGDRPPMLKSMDEAMTDKMLSLLKDLMKRTPAQHFNRPVDWERLKLWTYPQVILTPMDLGTVLSQLQEDRARAYPQKRYQFAEEFAHDVRLVFKNSFIFNLPNNPVYKCAKQVSEIFEAKLIAVYKEVEHQGAPCPLKVRCQLLLSDMRRNPLSEWFRREKDWKQFGETYVQHLTSGMPMDLDTVQRRLVDGDYDVEQGGGTAFSVDSFARDVRLVWANAMEFNKEGVFWLCPKILDGVFSKRLELLKSAPRPGDRGKRAAEREGWPSFERKRDLARKCARLPTLQANEAANHVRRDCAAAVSVVDAHGVQQAVVDLDSVDEKTFATVEALVNKSAHS